MKKIMMLMILRRVAVASILFEKYVNDKNPPKLIHGGVQFHPFVIITFTRFLFN
jgi:hypothetical protein